MSPLSLEEKDEIRQAVFEAGADLKRQQALEAKTRRTKVWCHRLIFATVVAGLIAWLSYRLHFELGFKGLELLGAAIFDFLFFGTAEV